MERKEQIAIGVMSFLKEKLKNGIYGDFVGNFDIAISALEKQIPKKSINNTYGVKNEKGKEIGQIVSLDCPCCQCGITKKPRYCSKCGQALDWSDI